MTDPLRRVATVHSGRAGVAVDVAPAALAARVSGRDLGRFSGARSGVIFLVVREGTAGAPLGIVRVLAGGGVQVLRVL
ncbi:hypothetical protein E4Z66_17285 [Aliishimia ponticola]|uniref:Uncharacterized protein n=1 Tax=Aliishimia ponticola TaxID=2499833 RepID=A0A4S4N6G6_9RHOB|nr:hypothetical protein [Aliishimia ponticola]THH34722.1 hypothetical protein E4Z66_17285 [Aliishimia ponticola]